MTTSVWVNARTILPNDYLVEARTTARWVHLEPDKWIKIICADDTVRTYHAHTAVLVRRAKERY